MTDPRSQDRQPSPARPPAESELSDVALDDVLEACQPSGRELRDPELASIARRIAEQPQLIARLRATQAADRRLAEAFRAVEIPPGLKDRVLAALAAAAPGESAEPADVARPARRARAWAAALTLTAAAALLLAFFYWRSPSSYRADSIADYAQRALENGKPPFRPGAPADLELPPRLAGARIESWAPTTFLEREAMLLRLERNGVRATLILAPLRGPTIAGRLPRNVYTTGKLAIGVLPDRKQLCVLAVEGDATAYRRFVEGGAVARTPGPRSRVSRAAARLESC